MCTGSVPRARYGVYSGAGVRVYGVGQGSTGVGYGDRVGGRRGNTGTQPRCSREGSRQRSGPRSPCRGRSGWSGSRNVRSRTPPTPCGRGPLRWVLLGPPRAGASYGRANRQNRQNSVRTVNVSQNRRVSPKSVHKAYHSPCSQNGLKKSPLEILRFTDSLAFSHKELMGHF